MTAMTIDRVALHGGAAVATRRRALARLGRLDPRAPGAPNEVLIVRRLADPLPGALARARGGNGAAMWESALSSELGRVRDLAVRPKGGDPATGADAVLFSDEAEMIACLAECLAAGRAPGWWARALMRRVPPGAGPVAVLAQQPHLMPAVVDALLARGTAEPVFADLTAVEVKALAQSAAVPWGAVSDSVTRASSDFVRPEKLDKTQPATGSAPPALTTALQRLPAAPAQLLAALWLRRHRPGITADLLHDEAVALIQIVRAANFQDHAGKVTDQRPLPPSEQDRPRDVRDQIAQDRSPEAPVSVRPPNKADKAGQNQDTEARLDDLTLAPAEDLAPVPTKAPNPPEATPPQEKTRPDATEGTATRIAGVLFLINLFVGAIPHRAPALTKHLGKAALPDDGTWTALERLARAILNDKSAETNPDQDSLWRLLAQLDGRARDQAAPPLAADHAAADTAKAWIAQAAWGPDKLDRRTDVPSLLRLEARVYATPAHLDVVFPADAALLPVRRAGLDVDPRWQPRFGRIIAFHYRE